MGAIWRGMKNSFLQQVTGGVRLEQAYRPSDEFMAALRAELRRALLRFGGLCPHGKPVAIDSFDLHWGSAEQRQYASLADEPSVTIRWVCRHDGTAGGFSPSPGLVVVPPPEATREELRQIARDKAEFARKAEEWQRQADAESERHLDRELGKEPATIKGRQR